MATNPIFRCMCILCFPLVVASIPLIERSDMNHKEDILSHPMLQRLTTEIKDSQGENGNKELDNNVESNEENSENDEKIGEISNRIPHFPHTESYNSLETQDLHNISDSLAPTQYTKLTEFKHDGNTTIDVYETKHNTSYEQIVQADVEQELVFNMSGIKKDTDVTNLLGGDFDQQIKKAGKWDSTDSIDENSDDSIEYKTSSGTVFLAMTLSGGGDSVEVSWKFNTTNVSLVDAFLVTYKMNSRENYDSSRLGVNVRTFRLHSLHEDDEYLICVKALHNKTTVSQVCKDWSESSMKIVVGILAGVVFLIPCLIVLIWIIFKDKSVKKKRREEEKIFEKLIDDKSKTKTVKEFKIGSNDKIEDKTDTTYSSITSQLTGDVKNSTETTSAECLETESRSNSQENDDENHSQSVVQIDLEKTQIADDIDTLDQGRLNYNPSTADETCQVHL